MKNKTEDLARNYVNENNHENTLHTEKQNGMYIGFISGRESMIHENAELTNEVERLRKDRESTKEILLTAKEYCSNTNVIDAIDRYLTTH